MKHLQALHLHLYLVGIHRYRLMAFLTVWDTYTHFGKQTLHCSNTYKQNYCNLTH